MNKIKATFKQTAYGIYVLIISLCIACTESPMEVVKDDIADTQDYLEERHERENSSTSESDKCYYGESSYSDSWCCSNYGYRCSDESSSSMSESDKCYFGLSSYSDSYCCTYYGYRCSYVSSSSSYITYSSSSAKTEVVEAHTSKSKEMVFTLTYYKQKTACWDSELCLSTTYTDGDPAISFTVYFIASGGQSTSSATGTLLSLQDKGSWSGTKTTTISVPIGTQDIKICPKVVDQDVLSDDNMSSGYCYTKTNVGYLSNYTIVDQSDFNSTKYTLEWNWYLY